MPSQKDSIDKKFTFEFYDDVSPVSLDEEITEPIGEYSKVDFQKLLNEEQLEIVNNLNGPMLVIAGAGSGKTRTIVYSVAKLLLSGIKPTEIMLVTFTNKAAHEMITRVEKLLGKKPKGIWAGTFHALANRFLRIYAKTLGLKPNYIIMDETDSKALMKIAINLSNVQEIEERFPTGAMAKDILSYAINCNKSIKEVIEWRYNQFNNEKVILKLKEVFKKYAQKKAEDSLVDFDDLLVFWNRLLDEKNVARLIAKKIKYVLVDEYQDTNYIQDEIIHKIVVQNPSQNVMVVGDDAQSIYAFRGANYENILNFRKKYKNCRTRAITYNYRSVPEILKLANNSIIHNKKQYKKQMRSTRGSGIKPFQVDVEDDKTQARFIANQVLKLRSDGIDLNEIAILIRAGHHSMKIELELQAKNIPYEVRAGVAFFEKAHIKDMLSHLRIIENPYDEISWFRIFTLIQGIGNKSASKIFQAIAQTSDPINSLVNGSIFNNKLKGSRISQKGKKNLIKYMNYLTGYESSDEPGSVIKSLIKPLETILKTRYENWQDRKEDLKQLSLYSENFDSIRKFLENLSLNGSNIESKTVLLGDSTEEEKPLVISTIHRAKGLEWKVIFIPMLSQDYFPSSQVAGDQDALEEERRVFYVAVTRAKDQLYLISPAMIQTFGGNQLARLSQFIFELNPNVYTESDVKFRSRLDSISHNKGSFFKSAKDLLDERKN